MLKYIVFRIVLFPLYWWSLWRHRNNHERFLELGKPAFPSDTSVSKPVAKNLVKKPKPVKSCTMAKTKKAKAKKAVETIGLGPQMLSDIYEIALVGPDGAAFYTTKAVRKSNTFSADIIAKADIMAVGSKLYINGVAMMLTPFKSTIRAVRGSNIEVVLTITGPKDVIIGESVSFNSYHDSFIGVVTNLDASTVTITIQNGERADELIKFPRASAEWTVPNVLCDECGGRGFVEVGSISQGGYEEDCAHCGWVRSA